MKTIGIIMAGLFCSFSLAAQNYSGGNGTANSPYLISSKADMETLAMAVNQYGKNYATSHFLLTNDIEKVTTVIGISEQYPFRGSFDGNHHAISVEINKRGVDAMYVGVFGLVQGVHGFRQQAPVIKNLGVKGNIKIYPERGDANVGGICGLTCTSSSIYNCYNEANIEIENNVWIVNTKNVTVGGICGQARNSIHAVYEDDAVNIHDCYNFGKITVIHSNANSSAGGICGFTYYKDVNINNCYNAGNISVTTGGPAHASVGHILAAYGYATIVSNCFSISTINASGAGDLSGSRISGDNNYSLSNVYSISDFQSQTWIETHLGWDFSNTWVMSDINSPSKGLPVFKKPEAPWVANDNIGFGNAETQIPAVKKTASGICVESETAADVSVYTVSGQMIYKSLIAGNKEIALQKGIYILNINGKGQKIIIN